MQVEAAWGSSCRLHSKWALDRSIEPALSSPVLQLSFVHATSCHSPRIESAPKSIHDSFMDDRRRHRAVFSSSPRHPLRACCSSPSAVPRGQHVILVQESFRREPNKRLFALSTQERAPLLELLLLLLRRRRVGLSGPGRWRRRRRWRRWEREQDGETVEHRLDRDQDQDQDNHHKGRR